MIPNFFYPYDDEIFYSWVARYHKYSSNNSKNQTLYDLYNKRHFGLNLHYPNKISQLVDILKKNSIDIDEEYIISNMLFAKIVKPFFENERYEKAREAILTSSKQCYRYHGFHMNGILKNDKDTIKVCPICYREDIKRYGEAYLHRSHNAIGVKTCYKHNCFLDTTKFNFNSNYIWDINSDYKYQRPRYPSEDMQKNYNGLAIDMQYLLNVGLDEYNPKEIQKKIQTKLLIDGIYNSPSTSKHPVLINFLEYYGLDFLKEMESSYSLCDKIIWVRNILHGQLQKHNPIRWVLIIRYLFGSLKEFSEFNEIFLPFGETPYPCLNNFCKYYNHRVITSYSESTTDNIKYVIGTFKCDYCGFTYTRRNDKPADKIFNYTKVKERGWLWKEKLKDKIISGENSPTKLAIEFNIDKRDIVKYANDFGLANLINSERSIIHKGNSKNYTVNLSKYKEELTKYIYLHPNENRTKIIKNNRKIYSTIYKRDKKWLEKNMPEPVSKKKMKRKKFDKKYWNKKDNEISRKIELVVNNIINNNEKVKITKSLISKRIGYNGINKLKYLNKMPKSKELIDKHIESVEDYKNRKKVII